MTRILIVYASSMGNTKRMAEAIAEGAREMEEVNVQIRSVEDAKIDEVWRCDALVLGSPVRHGNADSRLRHFIESDCDALSSSGRLTGKLGAVFTVGGQVGRAGDGGDIAQLGLLRAFAAAGMTILSAAPGERDHNAPRPYWGPHGRVRLEDYGREALAPDTLAQARAYGLRLARHAQALSGRSSNVQRSGLRLPSIFYRLSAVFR